MAEIHSSTPGRTIGRVSIYGCGGTGMNIANRFNAPTEKRDGQADIRVAFADTSRSNVKPDMSEDDLYIIPKVDGSGKDRAQNAAEIAKHIKPILQKFEPGDFNIIVCSGAGGSGSVLGPLILTELSRRQIPAVIVMVGSTEDNKATKNTHNAFKSLEGGVKVTGIPAVIYYHQNTPKVPQSQVDHRLYRVVKTLTILTSRDNDGMDTRDILNWVQFHRATSAPASLALLEVYDTNAAVDENHKTPISIASLLKTPDDARYDVIPEYSTTGYPRQEVGNFEQLHFVIDQDDIRPIVDNIAELYATQERNQKSRVAHTPILGSDDNISDDGLVL